MALHYDETGQYHGPTCNALLQRKKGDHYCQNPAGKGTVHEGEGLCYLHGGERSRQDAAEKLVPWLTKRTRQMSAADAEALMTMGTNAMVLARAELVERLIQPGLSTKEISDLTTSLGRLDKLIAQHPELENPDAAPNSATDPVDTEYARLVALEGGA